MKKFLLFLVFFLPLVSNAQDGSMDPSFGVDGVIITDINNSHDFGWAIVEQADHKLVVSGTTSLDTNQYNPFLIRYMPDGSLDSSFGNGGKIITNHGVGYDGYNYLFIDNQQSITAAGNIGYGSDFIVEKYLTNGTLDNNFGNNGVLTISDGHYSGMTLLDDGTMLLLRFSGSNEITIDNYLNNGILNTNFGTNGHATSTFVGDSFRAIDFKVDALNNIYFLGKRDNNGMNSDIILMKFQSNGFIDTGFGTNGSVIKNLNAGNPMNSSSAGFDFTDDGKIVVAGTVGACVNESQSIRQSFFWKLNDDGTSAANFGQNGTLMLPSSGFEIFQLLIQANQRMIVAGRIQDCFEGSFYIVRRYYSDGFEDNSFIGGGGDFDYYKTILQEDGKIVSIGNTFWYTGEEDIVVLRHNNTTLSIPDFGTQKTIIYPNPSNGIFTVEGDFYSEKEAYQITDVTGKIILRGELSGKQTQINFSSVQSGIYFLKTSNGVFRLLKN